MSGIVVMDNIQVRPNVYGLPVDDELLVCILWLAFVENFHVIRSVYVLCDFEEAAASFRSVRPSLWLEEIATVVLRRASVGFNMLPVRIQVSRRQLVSQLPEHDLNRTSLQVTAELEGGLAPNL